MKILIIQQKMIGDVLTSSILFEAIKQKYPESELHYVINSHTYPVVQHNPFIDQFHFFTPKHEESKRLLWSFANKLRAQNFDCVIDVYSKLSSNIMTMRTKAKTKISIEKGRNSLFYNHRFKHKASAATNAGLAVENRLQLLKPLDIDDSNIIRPKIYLTDAEKSRTKDNLERSHINLKKPLFMIGVLGSATDKTYPFEYMAQVIDQIVQLKPNAQLLFNYIPKQVNAANKIVDLCSKATQNRISFGIFGKNLRDFLALTSFCDALIGNEGGAINMAKALSVPTFTIFSPWIKKEAWNMFDDGKRHVSVHLKDYNQRPYDGINHPKKLKPKAKELYLKFKPDYFESDLQNFLDQFNSFS